MHKPGNPPRPVVACVDTTTSGVSHVLQNVLIDDLYNVKNSFKFKEILSEITVEGTDKLVSFYIVSLFTNIPVNLASNLINDQWDKKAGFTNIPIPRSLLFDMLRFCLVKGNYFTFKDVAYRQTFGMPMGSPLSTVIADIITQKLLNVVFGKLSYVPKLFVKYVDDIFAIVYRKHL